MAASFLSPTFRQRFFDSNGLPLNGGKLYAYAAGTTTPQDTYVNASGTLNTNPVTLDANGYADVWIDPTLSYKFILKDSGGNTLWTVDNVSSPFEVTAWSSTVSYSQGQIVADSSGYGLFYVSLTNNNVNNALTSVSNWRRLNGNIRTLSTNTTLLVTDELIRSNSTAGSLTHTLPPVATTSIGTRITIKDVGTGGNSTSVKGNASELIDGINTWGTALTQYMQATFECNGTSWDVISGLIDSSVTTQKLGALAVTNAKVATSAAIAYSKLALSGSIVNADVATGAAVAYSKLNLSGSIVNADVASAAAIAGSKLATNSNLPGSGWTGGGRNLLVAYSDPVSDLENLGLIRGVIDSTGGKTAGNGFSCTRTGTGVYSITWSTAFSSTPAVVATLQADLPQYSIFAIITSNTAVTVKVYDATGTASSQSFSFIAVGIRAS